MTLCATPRCREPVSSNSIACHEHFTERVPGFLARSYFATRNRRGFTADWIRAQVVHALRGEPYAP